MSDLLQPRIGDEVDAALSATPGWFECWCGAEWWINDTPAEDSQLDRYPPCACDRCADPAARRRMWEFALGGGT